MKSITIHGLDDDLDQKIKKKAETEGISINKVIKKALEEAFGGKKNDAGNKDEFLDLYRSWTPEDLAQFDRAVADFETISREDWL